MTKHTERARWMRSIVLTIGIGVVYSAHATAQETKPKPEAAADNQAKPTAGAEPAQPKVEPALRGYCPAAYILHGKAMKGDPKLKVRHQASVYYLSSEEAKVKFEDAPGKFLPQFGGLCTTALGGSYGNRFEGDPEVFDVKDGKVYLFSSERAKRAYDKFPQRFLTGGVRLFAEAALEALCPVAFQKSQRAVRGNRDFVVVYKGWQYFLSSGEAKLLFERNPEKYLPQYDGLCAEGVSRGKRYKGDLSSFEVIDGRTFLFFDHAARAKFVAFQAEKLKAADERWKSMANEE